MSIIWNDRHKNTVKFIHSSMDTKFFSLTNFPNVSLTLVEDFSQDIYSIETSQAAVYWLFKSKDLLSSERTTPSHFACSFLCSLSIFPDVSVTLHDLSFKNDGL